MQASGLQCSRIKTVRSCYSPISGLGSRSSNTSRLRLNFLVSAASKLEQLPPASKLRIGHGVALRNIHIQKKGQSLRRVNTIQASMAPSTKSPPGGTPWFVHALIFTVPLAIALTFFNGTRFGYHPPLMAAGFLFFMGEGVLMAIEAKGKQRIFFIKYHLALQMLATAAIVGGFYAIYSNKVIANKAHFTTSHAKLSLVVLVASLLVQIGGAFSFFGLPKALKKHTALVNKAHKMFGGVAFVGSIAALLLGLQVANPEHPLHKGLLTYSLAVGSVAIGAAVLRQTFVVAQAKKSLLGSKEGP